MAASIVTKLTANTQQFESQLNRAGRKVRTFATTSQRDFNGLGSSLSRLGGLLGAAFVGRVIITIPNWTERGV